MKNQLRILVRALGFLFAVLSLLISCAVASTAMVATAFGIFWIGDQLHDYLGAWGVVGWALFLVILALNVWDRAVKLVSEAKSK